jgi:hypothetical protein
MHYRVGAEICGEQLELALKIAPVLLCLRLQRGSGIRRVGLEGRGTGHTRWGNAGGGAVMLLLLLLLGGAASRLG